MVDHPRSVVDMVVAMSSNFGLIGFTVSEVVRFLDFCVLYSRPLLGVFGGIFPQNEVTDPPTSKGTCLRGNTSFES